MLRQFFGDEIAKKDPAFFQRLEESKFLKDDKTIIQTNGIFNDENYKDADYYQDYPTIFHLRYELINSNEYHDVRLVYLAVLNIFKHRGHFLNQSASDDDNDDTGIENIDELFKEFAGSYFTYSEEIFCDINLLNECKYVLEDTKLSSSKKLDNISEVCDINKKNKSKYEFLKAICGLSFSTSIMFPRDEEEERYDDETKKFKMSFKDSDLEEKLTAASGFLTDEEYDLLLILNRIYSWSTLASIIQGDVKYLSQARIKSYEKHKEDLRLLKQVYRTYCTKEQFDSMFCKADTGSYSKYIDYYDKNEEAEASKNRRDEFFGKVKKDLNPFKEDENVKNILDDIDNETFMPKQLTSGNGNIPYQLHEMELKKILENASCYLPFLNEKDEEYGLMVKEKIEKLFSFNISYYVGPLRNTQNGTGWSKVLSKGKITPWNFEDKIDKDESKNEFIRRLIRDCSYLEKAKVLPKESLLYQKFCVLNDINKLKVNEEPISIELKQKLYKELFSKGKKVTQKKIKDFLVKDGRIKKDDDCILSGFIDDEKKNTLSSYNKFREALEKKEGEVLTYEEEQMAEDIIYLATIFSCSKKEMKEKISKKYGNRLSEKQIDRISGYKFKDWGRLSREFLELPGNEEGISIIERLWNTNDNLMELLNGSYGFAEELEKKKNKAAHTLSNLQYEDLNGMYLSNPVKRMIWQTIFLLKEIVDAMGCEPSKVFVEMTRSEGEKGKSTKSRQKQLIELYEACKEDESALFGKLKNEEESDLRSAKLYLYYMQKGRCMYSGDIIDFDKLMDSREYDIDHIYPQNFIKDDSLQNNRVLCKQYLNKDKSNKYPLPSSCKHPKSMALWEMLYKQGFINETKYSRLMRNKPFTDDEKAAFISRQLVEVAQGTKATAKLMKDMFPNSRIVYVKARNVSDFRQENKFVKVRELNDLHHAQDAYLNIVVGNVYDVKFTQNPKNFIKEYNKDPRKNGYNMDKLFSSNVIRNDEVAWKVDGNYSKNIVNKMMSKNTPLVTFMSFEQKGGITRKDTIFGKNVATKESYMPVSTDPRLADVTKYGGRRDITGTYFFLVEHTEKGKRIRTLEPMYLYMADKYKTKEELEEYCRNELKLQEPSVRLMKIKMYSKIKVNGYEVYLTGRGGNQLLISNAVQLKLGNEEIKYLKKIFKSKNENYAQTQFARDEITKENNLKIYDCLAEKVSNGIYDKRINRIKFFDYRDNFEKIDIEKQRDILVEIITKYFSRDNKGTNIADIGGKKQSGVMVTSKKISKNQEFTLVYQSVTGLYESKVDLLKV